MFCSLVSFLLIWFLCPLEPNNIHLWSGRRVSTFFLVHLYALSFFAPNRKKSETCKEWCNSAHLEKKPVQKSINFSNEHFLVFFLRMLVDLYLNMCLHVIPSPRQSAYGQVAERLLSSRVALDLAPVATTGRAGRRSHRVSSWAIPETCAERCLQ